MSTSACMAPGAKPRRRRRNTQTTSTPNQPQPQLPQRMTSRRARQPRARRGRGGGLPGRRTPQTQSSAGLWWLVGQFEITSKSQPGTLDLLVLHPTSFPGTPYAAACQHHTHRREKHWDLRIEVTAATTTGARVACFALPDPDWSPSNISQDMVWSACMNGMGTMANVTGVGNTGGSFRLRTATSKLSNALPPPGNYLGYAGAMLVVYLLQPPLAISGPGALTVTVLARVNLEVLNPVPGFMAFTQQPPAPGPGPGPGPSSWTIQLPAGKTTATIAAQWYNSHVASAWLAGGIYLRLPATKPTSTSDVYITGTPKTFAVYTCTVATQNWHDNDSTVRVPAYFTTWNEPGSSITQVVGFMGPENAINQARKETALIPHGAECCLIYSGTPGKWQDYFVLPSTGAATIGFVEYMLTEYSANVYKNLYELAAAGYAVDLPVRQRPQPSGEEQCPADDPILNWPCPSGPIVSSPAISPPSLTSSLTRFKQWMTSTMSHLQPTTCCETLTPTLSSPTSSWPHSFHRRAPWEEEERCDALTSIDTERLSEQLSHLAMGESPLQSFEIIDLPSPTSGCPGCADESCDWCFEDFYPSESPV